MRFRRPFDWVFIGFDLSFTEFSTRFTEFDLNFTEFSTRFTELWTLIDLRIDLPHASYLIDLRARMCLVS